MKKHSTCTRNTHKAVRTMVVLPRMSEAERSGDMTATGNTVFCKEDRHNVSTAHHRKLQVIPAKWRQQLAYTLGLYFSMKLYS